MKQHNYTLKLLRLHAEGKAPTAGLWRADIRHDEGCGIWNGGRCDCDPAIRFTKWRPENEVVQ
ncbi:MAG: hypothetical protein C5B58_10940 [Acidobacteria bacterium]|nr:MAG: hypothetical protein C5B58_10940 [Acidobacteriota bacterium]